MVKKCIRFLNELKADLTKPFIIFLIPEAAFVIKCFRMYFIRIFSFSTGLAPKCFDYNEIFSPF